MTAVWVKRQLSSEICATLYTDTGCICLLKFIIGFVAVSNHLCKLIIELLSVLQLLLLLLLLLLLAYFSKRSA